jgi:outer membrane protein assembly factor BamB
MLAVDPTGSGDVTKTKVLWRYKSPILQLLTPIIKDGLIYTVDTSNNLLCIEAKTGKVIYSKRLTAKYNASPVCAGGNIYFTSINGETLVIREGRELEIIARNKLKGETFASPAIVQKSIIMRVSNQLFRIG